MEDQSQVISGLNDSSIGCHRCHDKSHIKSPAENSQESEDTGQGKDVEEGSTNDDTLINVIRCILSTSSKKNQP